MVLCKTETSQRTHDVILTSLLRQNDVVASFWRNNDVIITSCVGSVYTWPELGHHCTCRCLSTEEHKAINRHSAEWRVRFFTCNLLNNSVSPFMTLWIRARFLSLVRSKIRLCSANHRAGYFSNLACDWLSIVWAYSGQETENGPWWCHSKWPTRSQEISRYLERHYLPLSRCISDPFVMTTSSTGTVGIVKVYSNCCSHHIWEDKSLTWEDMKVLWQGHAFRITGPLCRESARYDRFPALGSVMHSADDFSVVNLNRPEQSSGRWNEMADVQVDDILKKTFII